MRLTLRAAAAEDAPAVLSAILEGVRRNVYRDDDCNWPEKVKTWARDYRRSAHPDHRLLIALVGTDPVGYMATRPVGGTLVGRVPGGATELMAGGIFSGYEGHGLGRQLVCATIAMLRSENRGRVIVGKCEREASKMRHILESLGFERVPPRPDVMMDTFDDAFVLIGDPAC